MNHFFICMLVFGVTFFSWAETPPQWGAAPKGEEVLHEKVYKEVAAPVPYKSRKSSAEDSEEFGLDSLDEADVEDAQKEPDQEEASEDDFLKDFDEDLQNDPDVSGDQDASEESEEAPEEESEEEGLDALDEDLAQDPEVEPDEGDEEESEGDAS